MLKLNSIVLLALLIAGRLAAGDETRSSRAYASQMVPGAFIQSHDDKYPVLSGAYSNTPNRAMVELGLDEDKHMIMSARTICLKFDVEVKDSTGASTIYTNQRLSIDYNPFQQTRYKDKAQLVFPNVYWVRVYNMAFTTCALNTACALCSTPYTGSEVYVQAQVTTSRTYSFNFATTHALGGISDSLITSAQELEIRWDHVSGAEEYELEYTFVDNYRKVYGSYYTASQVSYNLEHDATRIVTTEKSYRIPLVYENGFIVYRIRPVGHTVAGTRVECAWAGAPASGVVSGAWPFIDSVTRLNNDALLWQSVKTFAENGRTGTGISFSDALGYNRQSLARLNTDQKTITQSTLYDFYGRPSISILPSPVGGLDLNYRFGLNKYRATAGATPRDFEKYVFDSATVNNVCAANGLRLDISVSGGAANYYSTQNSNKEGFQGYVPNADSLPYTQAKYRADGLGRVTMQSLPGPVHQLGSGKEIKYFYAQPTQVELDRLFGSEAPRATQCYKNYVLDPNGQMSTTYIDQYGRTMATALLGNSPYNVDSLANLPTSRIFADTLHHIPMNHKDTANKCIEVNTTFFVVDANTPQSFLYKTTLGQFGSACTPLLCYDCVYNLEISVRNDCGEEVFDFDNSTLTPSGMDTILPQGPYAASACSGPTVRQVTGSTLNVPVIINFQDAGTYSLHKKICVSEAPIEEYTRDFINNQTCADPCFYVDSLLSHTNFSGCGGGAQSCSDCFATISGYLSDVDSARIHYDLATGVPLDTNYYGPVYLPPTPQQKSAWYEGCAEMCGPITECEKYKRRMLADFWPVTGQFADTNQTGPRWAGSIMNPANTLFSGYNWTSPVSPTVYLNANAVADFVRINDVDIAPQNLTADEFIQNYRKSWADVFLTQHPEYCKLYFYCNVIGSSLDYDELMKKPAHYDTVCNYLGLIYPLGTLPGTIIAAPSCGSPVDDPILTSLSSDPAVIAFNSELLSNVYGTGQSIYEYVANKFYSPIPGGYVFGQDECNRDLMWDMFRSIYLTKKQALYKALFTAYQANPASYGYSGGSCPVSFPADYTSHFPNWADSLDTYVPAGGGTASSTLVDNLIANNNPADALSYQGNMNAANSATIAAACTAACAAYRDLWHQNLNVACLAYGTAGAAMQNDILTALQGVCEKGCDANNPGGACTTPGSSPYIIMPGSISVSSFQDVLNYYLGSGTCYAGVINLPKPYPFITTGTSPTAPGGLGSCQCDQLLQVAADFATMQGLGTLPAGVTEEWQLFRKIYGYDLSAYYALKCMCNAAVAVDGGGAWAPGHSWTNPENNYLASNPVTVHPKFTCPSCLKCSEVVTAIEAITLPVVNGLSSREEEIVSDSTNTYFVLAKLNDQFGVHDLKFYFDLYNDCKTFYSADADTSYTFSNNITETSLELFRYMNQVVENGDLLKNNRALSLCRDDKYYLSGLYTGNLPTLDPLTYKYTIAGSSLSFTIQSPGPANILVVTLTLPVAYLGTWADLLSLHNFRAWFATPAAGPNYDFKVDATDALYNNVVLSGNVTNLAFPIGYLSQGVSPEPAACPKTPRKKNTCAITLIGNALTQGRLLFQQKQKDLVAEFLGAYRQHCFNALDETFYRNYKFVREYNYTLYYYDEAGNLQRTVAPAGVVPLNITTNLPPTPATYPLHSLGANIVSQRYVSDYRFNIYNQPVKEKTVDGGETNYLYDPVGRILASQNAKQAAASAGTVNVYSYTLYDPLGRITQVGEMRVSSNILSSGNSMAYASFTAVVNGATSRKEVVSTWYDDLAGAPLSLDATAYFALTGTALQNGRNRVTCITYAGDPAGSYIYDHATYYSYDDHGNVERVLQENALLPSLLSGGSGSYNMRFKKTEYRYDLVSGNMLEARYQHRQPDQFMHRYYYDADNRLHEVYSSRDSLNWDRDAKYFYYEHGPLARVERADKQVQGEDFYYTIHGWLKGINSDAMQPDNDVGKDGAATNAYLTNYNKIHAWFAKDAMAFALNYYNKAAPTVKNTDYMAIKAGTFGNSLANLDPTASRAGIYGTNPSFYLDNAGLGDGPSLYNGNISSMVTGFIDKDASNTMTDNLPFVQLTGYRYDQLQRLTAMKAHRSLSGNAWNAAVAGTNYDASYKMNLSYDDNGNILSLFRNGADPGLKPGATLAMDNLSYQYETMAALAGANSNRLYAISDAATGSTYTDDVDGPSSPPAYSAGANRYLYDEVGNLKRDEGEYIDTIVWTVDRKVKRIVRDAAAMLLTGTGPGSVTKPDIEYEYNALRQRVTKIVKPRWQSTKALMVDTTWQYTYYVYDAGGNVMATYDRHAFNNGFNYTDAIDLGEHHLYGSKRLALARPVSTLRWSYDFSPCGIPGGVNNCRTPAPGPGVVPSPMPAPSATYLASRRLGYKEFELDNHLGNVIATVSDRKIILSACPNEFLHDFTAGPGGGLGSQTATLVVSSGHLRVIPAGPGSGVTFTYVAGQGDRVDISFDLDMSTSVAADSLRAYVYPYDSTTSHIGPLYNLVRMNAGGSYHLDFTGPPAGSGYNSLYVLISTQTATSTLHPFELDNLAIARILNGIPGGTPCSPYINAFMGYFPDLLMHTDYYPFGQQMPGRTWVANDYRYSHNGHEKEDELFKHAQSAEYWMYDARIGRRWERDPIKNASISGYAAFANNPIFYKDLKGLKPEWISKAQNGIKNWYNKVKTATSNFIKDVSKSIKSAFNKEDEYTPKDGSIMLKEVVITPEKRSIGDRIRNALHKIDAWFDKLAAQMIIWGTGIHDGRMKLPNGKIPTFDAGELVQAWQGLKSKMTGNDPNLDVSKRGKGLDEGKKKGKEQMYGNELTDEDQIRHWEGEHIKMRDFGDTVVNEYNVHNLDGTTTTILTKELDGKVVAPADRQDRIDWQTSDFEKWLQMNKNNCKCQ